ncbi:acyl-CoA N-acyltransferase [Penicillium odoratum]|uniref:acyl-CoA N-acyltransferase n=1 Tax=Penicillium odoratum TaxID=1167516 RepID=UPI0025470A23|nr:acyl-CoA N-acyltransferase [Penicillium odoratum]KAJ5760261.1 acyl-CoA N-acyltransferase [Penicillium odoratum]
MGSAAPISPAYVFRTHRPGDMGWIIHRHGVLYNQEFGWGERFEGVVAGIAGDFLKNFDPQSERCWIAEQDGKFLGCIMLVKDLSAAKNAAKIRLFLVEPSARGLGLGRALVRQCTQFAREVGYSHIGLWTQSELVSARHIYGSEGFVHLASEEHASFGIKMVGELWELQL